MNPTIPQLQRSFQALGYAWHPSFNLIGLRNGTNVSNAFNDQFVCAWLQPAVPAVKTVLEGQQWLNQYQFVGLDGLALSEDGISGPNYKFAAHEAARTAGTWRQKTWTITTDPGVYYLQNPINGTGCAVLKPGQYRNVWLLGFHQSKPDHPALVQHGSTITVYLDNNRDGLSDETGATKTGWFGINGHHAGTNMVSSQIGKWSAGCQVFPDHHDHARLLRLCQAFETTVKGTFTYTLLRERELV